MAWRELKAEGLDPYRDFEDLHFSGTHDAVVFEVLNGEVDAGTVRTDTLERMAAEGKIRLQDFRVIPNKRAAGDASLPFMHSTPAYPEWPFARARQTSNELADLVSVALLRMEPQSAAARAAISTGWTAPLQYQEVHECLKDLHVGPYEDYGRVTLAQAVLQHWPWAAGLTAFLMLVGTFAIQVARLNRRITKSDSRSQMLLESAERSERELKQLVEVAPIPIAIVRTEGNRSPTDYLNQTFVDLFGWSIEDLPDLDAWYSRAYPDPDYRRSTKKEFAEGLAAAARDSGHVVSSEVQVHCKDGRILTVQTSTAMVGERFITMMVDLTERKRAEEALAVAKEVAESANRTKSAFLANMSHELRTPMNAIIGYSELLIEEAEDLEPDEFVPDLEKIHRAGNHLLALINDILDLSKIEAGKMELYLETFDLPSVIDDVAATADTLIQKKKNTLRIEKNWSSSRQDRQAVR